MMPEVVVVMDFDGYFEAMVRGMVKDKIAAGQQFKHARIEVEGVPFLMSAAEYRSSGGTIRLQFYPALRTGFGSLSDEDKVAIRDLL